MRVFRRLQNTLVQRRPTLPQREGGEVLRIGRRGEVGRQEGLELVAHRAALLPEIASNELVPHIERSVEVDAQVTEAGGRRRAVPNRVVAENLGNRTALVLIV